MTISLQTQSLLRSYAGRYENAEFLNGDPSWFMHQVEGEENQETMAFLASVLSYGSRKQFIPKIQQLLNFSEYQPYSWVKNDLFKTYFSPSDNRCFYRLYSNKDMSIFLNAYSRLLSTYGSIRNFILSSGRNDAKMATRNLCGWFADYNTKIIPKDTQSACKRLCMFLRWMVRDNSPVDLGIWTDIIDKQTLIIPLDTHVLTEAVELGLISSRTATMSVAVKLTETLAQVFPDDPVKADFALFGYGVNKTSDKN